MHFQGGNILGSADLVNDTDLNVSDGGVAMTGNLFNGASATFRSGPDQTIQVGNFFNDGTLAPGGSPGLLTIDGHYIQGATGVLAVELGGTTPGTGHDALDVTGTVDLDGTLDVFLFGGFVGEVDDAFEIIEASSISGDFATKSFPAGYEFTSLAGAQTYTLTLGALPGVAGEALPAGAASDVFAGVVEDLLLILVERNEQGDLVLVIEQREREEEFECR